MGRPSLADTRDTRAEIMYLAQDFVQTRGYHGFSYQDISERLKITKASIHYHFPNKEDVAVALLDNYCERFEKWSREVKTDDTTPTSLLETYFAFFSKMSDKSSRICPCGAFAAEWNAVPEPVQAASLRLIICQRKWLKTILSEGRASGEFRAMGTPEDQARFIFSAMQGALQVSRSENDPGCFRVVVKQTMAAILA
jgi:TetR/AcrR family transcriptional repressor of nem operon